MSRNSEYFPSSKFLLHLEVTETKEIKRSGFWLIWHFSGVSCCTHTTVTHFLKLHWDGKHFQTSAWILEYLQGTLPSLSSLTLEKAGKICLLTWVILDCLRASKSCLCLREVFLSCLSCASAQPHRAATELPGLLASLLPVSPFVSPSLLSGGPCTHASMGNIYPRKFTRARIQYYPRSSYIALES